MTDNTPKDMSSQREGFGRGAVSILSTAIAWALFSWWLAADGHGPSGPSLFEEQYRTQAFLLAPVLIVSWLTFAGLLWQLLGKRSLVSSQGAWFEGLGGILGNGYFMCWVIPDLVVYGFTDFETLGLVAPVLPVLTTGFVVFLSVHFVRRRVPVSRIKAVSCVLGAWILQAIPVLVFIR